MKLNINKFLLPALAVAAVTLGSCSDWIEPESIDLKVPSLEEQNPELYAAYLQNLTTYKAGVHKVVFVAFENVAAIPTLQSEHLTVVPDSVDYISLNNPAVLNPVIIAEMDKVREKSTKVIYNIDYPSFESEWTQLLKMNPDLTEADALAYITKRTNEMLALCDQHRYDGLTITYPGRSLVSLTEAALAVYSARQKAFLDPVVSWRESHKSSAFSFIGNAQFLIEESKPILAACDYIILPTEQVTNATNMTVAAISAVQSGNVPSDRFVVAVQTTNRNDKDLLIGYFGTYDENGVKVRAIGGAAQWVGQASDFTRSGLLIYNIQSDYYDHKLVYRYTRGAIDIMNTSPKN